MSYKKKYPFKKRFLEAQAMLVKHTDLIPIIVEKSAAKSEIENIDKSKFLVPHELTVGQFIYVIRKRLKLKPEISLFIFIKGSIPPVSALMSQIYNSGKDEDGFLYVTYSGENCFGH